MKNMRNDSKMIRRYLIYLGASVKKFLDTTFSIMLAFISTPEAFLEKGDGLTS